jgi:hypothetical protein
MFPIQTFHRISLAGDIEFRVGKKKTLDKITIEEWGFANMRIMQELLKLNILANVNAYVPHSNFSSSCMSLYYLS